MARRSGSEAPPSDRASRRGSGRRRGRRVLWRWALPGLLLVVLLAFAGDLVRFAQSLALYGERSWPAWRLEWRIRREVLPALEARRPDEALRALAEAGEGARMFEDRVAPLRMEALLQKDDIPHALALYDRWLEMHGGRDGVLPDYVHETLAPHLEALRARRRASAISFEDATGALGAEFEHVQRGRKGIAGLYQCMGSGVGVLDLDDDGDLDLLYLGGGDPAEGEELGGNRLLRNRGDGHFEDATAGSGLEHTGFAYGVAAADLTGDGLPELYVTQLGANRLLRNRGGMRFEDVTGSAGLAGSGGASTAAAFGDVDGDGDLDLYVAQWVKEPRRAAGKIVELLFSERSRLALFAPHMYEPDANQLFLNQGELRFVDATERSGVADTSGRGLGVVLADFDGDHRADLFVANDVSPNSFYRNRGDGRFEDASASARMSDARAGMGVAVSDWDGDGALDLFYTNFRTEYNALVLNRLRGEGFFSEQTERFGLADGSLGVTSWGVVGSDFDNDGLADLAIVNGHPTPFDPKLTAFRGDLGEAPRCLAESPLVYERGEEGFVDVTPVAGAVGAWRAVGRGLEAGDLDRDGRIDLVATGNNGPARVFRNTSRAGGGWLVVRPRWRASNRLAVGASVRVETGAGAQTGAVLSGGSYLSQGPFEVHFGLGGAAAAEKVVVTWPDGSRREIRDVKADQVLLVDESTAPAG